MVNFLSLKCFTVLPHGIIDWTSKNIPAREGGVRRLRVRTQWGGCSKRTSEGKGVKFCHGGAYVLTELPLWEEQEWHQEFSDGGLKYGFQGTINAKNLRKKRFSPSDGGL